MRAAVLALAVAACTPAPTSQGCEVSCKMVFECAFGAPDQVPGCTTSCIDQLGSASAACKDATVTLGTCGDGKTCADFAAGACKTETDQATAACNGGGMPDAGVDAMPDSHAAGAFSIALDRTTISTELNRSESIGITVTASGGFAGPVDLAMTLVDGSGQATDWVAANPITVAVPFDGSATAQMIVGIPSDARTLAGTILVHAAASSLSSDATAAMSVAKQITLEWPAGTGAGDHSAIGPQTLYVRPGTQLVWLNNDATQHVVHGDGGILHEITTGGQPGGAYAVTVDTSGDWYCHTHELGSAARYVYVESP